MKKLQCIFLVLLVAFTTVNIADAHSGRTDKNGCHKDNKNGGRHCH